MKRGAYNMITLLGWIACAFTCIALYFLGKKDTLGWYYNIIGSALWLTYALMSGQWSLAVVNIIIAILNMKGVIAWRKHT